MCITNMTDGQFPSAYCWQYLFSIGGVTGEGNMVLSLYCLYTIVLTEPVPIGQEQIRVLNSLPFIAIPLNLISLLHSVRPQSI